MIHPGSLIRWGALGAVVLLVRAVVREAQAQRSPVILLPPVPERGAAAARGTGRSRGRPDERGMVGGPAATASGGESLSVDEPATEAKPARGVRE